MARKVKFLKLRMNDKPELQFSSVNGKATCTYQITDRTKGQAKLTFEVFIDDSAEEVILDVDTATVEDLKGCLQVDGNTTNKIQISYGNNKCVLADDSNNAIIDFSFVLPGKTPGTLGSNKIPNNLDSSIN